MDTGRTKKRKLSSESDEQGASTSQNQKSLKTIPNAKGNTILKGRKVFNDSVHGHIEFHPLLVRIIDTPEFQRLRSIKQLGMCYLVYPGATHTRFEHSLGVSYLAGELARILQKNQANLKITDKDILCVEVAGLCHDLGHGPFSHLFDNSFLPRVRPDFEGKHEKLSIDMFEHMLKNNKDLKKTFTEHGLTKTDITFIKEQIFPPRASRDGCQYKGRKKNKRFLYEIVANKRNGIDVDKWDYLARDSMYLGIKTGFDWRRSLKFARVLDVVPSGEKQICTRDKEYTNLYDMFQARYTIHRRACQHRVTKILDLMIVDALTEADDHLLFAGKDGKMQKTSESIDDMEAFSKLTDNVMWTIHTSNDEKLDKAKKLINRIMTRDLYICVGQTQLTKINKKTKQLFTGTPSQQQSERKKSEEEIHDRLSSTVKKKIRLDDIVVFTTSYDYGMGDKDPMEHVKFYTKKGEVVDISSLVGKDSMAMPRHFLERSLRICCKQSKKQYRPLVEKAFEKWCKDKGLKPKTVACTPTMSVTKKPGTSEKDKLKPGAARRKITFTN